MEREYKEIRIGDLFEIKKVYGQPFQKYSKGETPYVTGTENNNGVIGYVDAPDSAISKGNCISVDPIKGFAFYQGNDFVGRGFSGASINLLYHNNINETNALYLCAAIQKISSMVAAYTNLFNSHRLSNAKISLPIKDDDIDWAYMEDRIRELEVDRIRELEADRIRELEAYLTETGLEDYALTEEDREILTIKPRMEEFRIGDFFEKIPTGKIKKRAGELPKTKSGDSVIPLLTAGVQNQGLSRYAKEEECKTLLSNVISISANGENSGAVFYQSEQFAVLQDAYAIKMKCGNISSREEGLYLAGTLSRAISHNHNWVKKAGWENIKNDLFSVPIDDNDKPDFEYMRRYITAVEKLTIADVVKYKDEMIAATKQVVSDNDHMVAE